MMYDFVRVAKNAVGVAVASFAGLFPAAAVASSVSGGKAAAVAAIGAGIAAALAAAGSLIKQWREKAKGWLDAGSAEASTLIIEASKLLDQAHRFLS
jgi:hypothetical protein